MGGFYTRNMAGRRTNLGLLVLLSLAGSTGGLAFAAGTRWGQAVTIAHGVAGLGVLVLSPWKSMIVRRSLRRPKRWRVASVLLAVSVVVAVLTGVVHSALGSDLGRVTAMQVHVAAGIAALVLAALHVVTRPERVHRTDLSRRTVLRGGLVAAGSAAVLPLTYLPGGDRRFTGSHERADLLVTQWFNDSVPDIDVDEWRLRVGGRDWAYDELLRFDDRLVATLDCTGGWWSRHEWTGVRLDRLVDADGKGARSVVVRSMTGYDRRFPLRDVRSLLLATRLDGAALTAGHGFPVRLVARGRRGFWWVKWVESVDLSDRPWWWQPPFPLT